MFSSRVRHDLRRNGLAVALEKRRASGQPIIDLTLSNPTHAGFFYPADMLGPLAQPGALRYDAHPFGHPAAREAVSLEFARRGVRLSTDRIVLTASTSEAYSTLFKLLCNPGDVVLAPRPSYPLIEHLAELDGVRIEHYMIEFHARWTIDAGALEERLSRADAERVKAVILVTPNNPTGSVAVPDELAAIASVARRHGLAVISDEVFADYPVDGRVCPSAANGSDALTFVLGGLSKSIGLPQAKLAWVGVDGPTTAVAEAMERLETICDAYLSVSTPVQIAAPELLETGATLRAQIHERIRENLATLRRMAAASPACTVLPVEGGWYAVVRVPATMSEEALVVHLVESTGVLAHPGYFYDFDREAFLVISLLPEPAALAGGLDALFRTVA